MSERAPADAEAIRHRAYEISQGPHAGTEEENWLRAEDELRQAGLEEMPLAAGGASGSAAARGTSKHELYEEAKRLGIAGRSRMSKSELARAITDRS
jgi:hypothetical protein